MAEQFNPDDLKPEDLERMLSRKHEDRLDWLENQTPQPAPAAPAPPRGLFAALREFFARFRRAAGDVD
jgi:hypothetical protein